MPKPKQPNAKKPSPPRRAQPQLFRKYRFSIIILAVVMASLGSYNLLRTFFSHAATTTSTVPASVDASGSSDVTTPLNSYLSSLSDGTTVVFPAGARYRIEGTLILNGRRDITIEGNGSIFFATTYGLATPAPSCGPNPSTSASSACKYPNRTRSQWSFLNDTNLTVHNVSVIGAAPNPGPNGDYSPAYEAQHAFNIVGGSGITLNQVTAHNTWGDLVYVAASNVEVMNSVLDGASRQCFSVVNADHVSVHNNSIGLNIGCRRSMFDLEANTGSDHISYITISNNELGVSRFSELNNGGAPADEHDITFTSNHIHGRKIAVFVQGRETKHRSNYTITNNSSDVKPNEGDVSMTWVDGALISGNTQDFFSGGWPDRGPQGAVTAECSTNITVKDNNFTSLPPNIPVYQIIPCPVANPTPSPTTPTPSPSSSPSLTPVPIQPSSTQQVSVNNGITTVTDSKPQKVNDDQSTLQLIPAAVAANVKIVRAVYFIDQKLYGETTDAPFTLTIDPYKLKNGRHNVMIRSYTVDGKTVITNQPLDVSISWYKRFWHWLGGPWRSVMNRYCPGCSSTSL